MYPSLVESRRNEKAVIRQEFLDFDWIRLEGESGSPFWSISGTVELITITGILLDRREMGYPIFLDFGLSI